MATATDIPEICAATEVITVLRRKLVLGDGPRSKAQSQ
jgi:hypothetical protein